VLLLLLSCAGGWEKRVGALECSFEEARQQLSAVSAQQAELKTLIGRLLDSFGGPQEAGRQLQQLNKEVRVELG
jgi:hypothetical protein